METFENLATRAYAGISFSPEQRGASHAAALERHVAETRAFFERELPAEHVAAAVAEYRAAYEARYRAWLGALGRCVSPMIAGPSKFPVRRMEKRNATERRRLEELVATPAKLRRRILRQYRAKVDPAEAADAELAKLEARLAFMKAANAILRKKKLTPDAKVAAIVELGVVGEATARRLLDPDFAGRIGFPGYQLTSVNGKIKRRRAQLESLTAAATADEVTIGEATIEENAGDDRLRIHFPGKPDVALRTELKRNGFRWSPSAGAWQRQLTDAARQAARRILSTHYQEA